MVSELLAAFDELIDDLDSSITALNTQRSACVDDYNTTKAPYDNEMRLATASQNSA